MSWQANNLITEKHFFFGNQNGFSQDIYTSLNVNTKSNDSPDNIQKNLKLIADKFAITPQNLLLLNQGISADAVYVSEASQDTIFADGAVTTTPQIALCIRTADCAPILFEDRINNVIGAAHAGWRGAFKGIIENVVELMLAHGAKKENISAAIGPCIAQPSYEVDTNFYKLFLENSSNNGKYFTSGSDTLHHQFNLPLFCSDKLKNAGIKDITVCPHDTYTMPDKYFSYRRLCHQNQLNGSKNFGTHMSMIVL